jgi:hypothetical protein
MSDQEEAGVIASLEEVFLSREFGRAPVRRAWVTGGVEEASDTPELEQVFLSETFGKPQAVPALRAVPGEPEPVPDHPPGTLPFVPRESTRHRAVAAVSGVAAAALVVAGVASGNGQPGRPVVSAQGQRVSPRAGGGSSGPTLVAPPTGASVPAAKAVAPGGGIVAPNATTVAQIGRSGSAPPVVIAAPPGTAVTVVPSPAAPSGGSAGSTGGGAGAGAPVPTPTAPGAGNPLAPVTVVINNTGTTVTSVANQLGDAVPGLAPVTGALGSVGSTVNGLGSLVASTTTVA